MDRVWRLTDTENVRHLFAGWEETLIWSCLQGVMGEIYVSDCSSVQPRSAMAVLGDFTFLAGEPDEYLAAYRPVCCKPDFRIVIPQNDAWEKVIRQCYGEKAKKSVRYVIKKEPDIFDREKLVQMTAALPAGYELNMIDEPLYEKCKAAAWCNDFVSQYADYGTYREWGLGVVAVRDGEIVSGASSYSSYRGGIEIEVDTKEGYRRKGLATICAAKLILECLERGWYPSWDAQNLWSVALAEKLGYHFGHTYTAYEIIEKERRNEL